MDVMCLVCFLSISLTCILSTMCTVCTVQVGCIAVIIPAAMATIDIDTKKHDKGTSKELISVGKAVCGIVVVGGLVGVVLELATIILRFVNVGLINYKIKYFLLAVSGV